MHEHNIKLDLDNLSIPAKIAKYKKVAEKMSADANPDVSAAGDALSNRLNTLQLRKNEKDAAEVEAQSKTAIQNTQEHTADDAIRDAKTEIKKQYKDNPDKWSATGFDLADEVNTDSPTPETAPDVDIKAEQVAEHTIIFKEEGKTRGKPKGVHHIEIRYKIGDPAPANPNDSTQVRTPTKSSFKLKFDTEDSGKTVFYFFRWINKVDEPGPWTGLMERIIL